MKLIVVVLFQILVVPLIAQKSNSRVVYKANHKLAMKSNFFNGLNTLQFNGNESIFSHNNYPKENTSKSNGNLHESVTGDEEHFPIYISLKDSLLYSKVAGMYDAYSLTILKEKLEPIKWVIGKNQKQIGVYNCISATAKLDGREYEAWFTPEIPTSFGPYHLYGLPGLILEAKSLDGDVSWTFVGYEQNSNDPIEISKPINGDLMEWDELVTTRLDYKYMKESKSFSGATLSIIDTNENRYIRKGKFNIFKKYLNNK
jgi:GLPGLI family protein